MLSQHQQKYVKQLLCIYTIGIICKKTFEDIIKMIIKLKSKGIIGNDSVCS